MLVDSKLKDETRDIAFKNRMTISAYIRFLISMGNIIYKNKELSMDLDKLEKRIKNIKSGGMKCG